MNNNLILRMVPLTGLMVMLSGCRAIEGIFKAGVWVGIVGVLLLVGLVFGAMRLVAR